MTWLDLISHEFIDIVFPAIRDPIKLDNLIDLAFVFST